MYFSEMDKMEPVPPKVPARPAPRSQKEATMAVEPAEEAIQNLVTIMDCSRATAIRYLRVKQNNVEAAVDAMFQTDKSIEQLEQETQSATTWDEGAFSAGRDGEPGNQHLLPMGATAPNTRANSPAPNRASLHPSSKEQEDADFAAAMSASQQDISTMPFQQESGVIKGDGTEEKHFGPANRDHYEPHSWAMVHTAHNTADEIVPDVDVEHRKNVPGEPRFLKHVPTGDYISAFLTICHTIAGVREAMLMRGHVRREYGVDGEWWRGHAISLPMIVHTESGQRAEPDDKYDDLVAEVQRLMAFLDASERSYASPGALTQTDAMKNVTAGDTKSGTLVEYFIQEWMVAGAAKSAPQGGDMYELFTTTVLSDDLNKSDDCERFLLNLPVSASEGESVDLSELLDNFFWGQDAADMAASGDFVNSPAEVIVMRLVHEDKAATQLRAEVPGEFYMDKYLRENKEAASEVRRQIAQGKGKLKKIGEIEKKLTTWKHPTKNEQIDARLLLKHTHGHFAGGAKLDADKADQANGVIPTVNDNASNPPHYADIASKLDKVISSIDNKLAVLASEKEKTRKALADMSKNPLPSLEGQLKYRYTLRGVATKPNTTYILRPKEEDEDEEMLIQVDEDGTPEGMQWWRIEYEVNASGSGAKVTKTKAPDYDVLRAVELEHREAMLVYASDEANDIMQHNSVLPEPLMEFVKRDNELFRQELADAASRAAPPAYDFGHDGVRESIEKRDSMDSTRAQGGVDYSSGEEDGVGGLPGYGQGNFHDHPGFGLGPADIKMGTYAPPTGPPPGGDGGDEDRVHEIRLDDDLEDAAQTEMVQKPMREPLIPGLTEKAMKSAGGQDLGVGGAATHVEDAEMD